MYGYVDGSISSPPKVIATAATSTSPSIVVPNPAYKCWFQLSTIMSPLTDNVLAQMVGYETSRDVWMALERMYTSKSRSRIFQIQTQLATLSKGNATLSEYFQRVKSLSDTLVAASKPLSEDESTS